MVADFVEASRRRAVARKLGLAQAMREVAELRPDLHAALVEGLPAPEAPRPRGFSDRCKARALAEHLSLEEATARLRSEDPAGYEAWVDDEEPEESAGGFGERVGGALERADRLLAEVRPGASSALVRVGDLSRWPAVAARAKAEQWSEARVRGFLRAHS